MTPEAIIAEAKTWLRTPFRHRQRVKGIGVDCALFIAEVYERTGCIPHVEPPPYTRDWFLHCKTEDSTLYSDFLDKHLERTAEWGPGRLVAFQYGRCKVAHAAIIIDAHTVIAASSMDRMVCLNEWDRDPLASLVTGFWSPKCLM